MKLTEEELHEITALLQPTIEMNFERGQSTIQPQGNWDLAMKTLNKFAIAKGAQPLPDGQYYGLAEDGTIIGLERQPLNITGG